MGARRGESSGRRAFGAVGHTAILATVAAVLLTVIGVHRRDSRAVLVGTAFTAMAALLALHGLATPGVIVGYNGVVSALARVLARESASPLRAAV